jgi:hypothetical protein
VDRRKRKKVGSGKKKSNATVDSVNEMKGE